MWFCHLKHEKQVFQLCSKENSLKKCKKEQIQLNNNQYYVAILQYNKSLTFNKHEEVK